VHADDCAVAGLHEPDAVGDVQGLADGVGVPVGAGAGGEPDGADDHPGGLFALCVPRISSVGVTSRVALPVARP
jgi:hypothetical protein